MAHIAVHIAIAELSRRPAVVAGEIGHDIQVDALRVHRQPAHDEILLHTVTENAHADLPSVGVVPRMHDRVKG